MTGLPCLCSNPEYISNSDRNKLSLDLQTQLDNYVVNSSQSNLQYYIIGIYIMMVLSYITLSAPATYIVQKNINWIPVSMQIMKYWPLILLIMKEAFFLFSTTWNQISAVLGVSVIFSVMRTLIILILDKCCCKYFKRGVKQYITLNTFKFAQTEIIIGLVRLVLAVLPNEEVNPYYRSKVVLGNKFYVF